MGCKGGLIMMDRRCPKCGSTRIRESKFKEEVCPKQFYCNDCGHKDLLHKSEVD